ncbi:GntR family transcriptional regulator [Xinfangfangia pollutisoli]|uniref:GntR family transcriptional regulator n=1 Tax=Xinfangfangia pollutisoli TaxID=2865960 RepID=UPI001CD6F4C9|nr:GntR family transcriptional regulator [Xinfangfangia pollutisoli]
MVETSAPIDLFPRRTLSRADGPLYKQLADLIRDMIATGRLEVGTDLPKEAELEEHLGVSLITVRRGLRELEDLGLIQKRSAKPARVTASTPTQRGGTRFMAYEDLTDFTRGGQLVVESYDRIRGPAIEKYFGLAKDQDGWCLRGQLVAGDQVRTIVTTYFPPEIGDKLRIADFSDVLIFRNVERCLSLTIERVLISVRAEIAGKKTARALSIAPGSALMTTEMVYMTRDRKYPVEVTVTQTPSELFTLSYDIPLSTP